MPSSLIVINHFIIFLFAHFDAMDAHLFLLNNAFFSNLNMIRDGRYRRCLAKLPARSS